VSIAWGESFPERLAEPSGQLAEQEPSEKERLVYDEQKKLQLIPELKDPFLRIRLVPGGVGRCGLFFGLGFLFLRTYQK
jgi:hypothetical protein